MSRERPLRGGCSCGRNTYIIEVPEDATEAAQVFFDRSTTHLRTQASPLSAWLRVPLSWYHSTTYAFFDDETHAKIRRVYTSPLERDAKRHFCGFCGTPLSYWSESPPSEAEYISLTLGSLSGDDLRDLDDLGLLPKDALGELKLEDKTVTEQTTTTTVVGEQAHRAEGHQLVPWFESMLQGSSLGRVKRSRGSRQTHDGRVRMEWEIVELLPDDDEANGDAQATGKRKLDDIESHDAVMEEGQ